MAAIRTIIMALMAIIHIVAITIHTIIVRMDITAHIAMDILMAMAIHMVIRHIRRQEVMFVSSLWISRRERLWNLRLTTQNVF